MPFPSTYPRLAEALAERGYVEPTPVQERVLDPGLTARDLLVSAQTGTGKTIAYGLAFAPTIMEGADAFGPATDPLALVIAPTRELAIQVASELAWLYARTDVRIVTCVGGMDPRAEKRRLDAGAHIVVGTPGRLRDHLERRALRIARLRALVLDEADEMLNLGFREDLEFLLQAMPEARRTLLFSATLPKAIVAMANRYQANASRIEVAAGQPGHADIEYRLVPVVANEVEHAVVNLLRASEASSAIVFCKTREAVRHLHSNLLERGFAVVALSGELGQAERNQTMQALRDGRARVCVATDVAARGIDLPSLGLVIHADLPNDAETLQHRSGRTGRAGRKGVSALLVPLSRRRKADRLLAEAGIQAVRTSPPTADDIRRLDEERLRADPMLVEEPTEEERASAEALLRGLTPQALAVALVRFHRARLPAAEDLTETGFPAESRTKGVPPGAERRSRVPNARPAERGPSVWFRMDVGRRNEADPKWILPLLCRVGKVSRQEIGAIKIYDRETKFEVARDAADRFALEVADHDEDGITIAPADGAELPGKGAARPARRRHGSAPERAPGGDRKAFKPKNKRRDNAGKPQGGARGKGARGKN